MIGLDKNELKVFKKLTLNPQSVAELVRALKMPRMTVYTNLLRLKKNRLAQESKSESGKRTVWLRNSDVSLQKEVFETAESILGKPLGAGGEIHHYAGKEDIKAALMNLTTRKDGARMYSIQSSKNWPVWIKLMGKEWVNKHNRAVVKHKLIALTIHSAEAPVEIKKDKEVTEAYKGRLGNSHSIPEEFLPQGLSLYIFEETILLVDLQQLEAVSFSDENMAHFLVRMFAYMFERSEREEFFQKFNR